mmetsp:Transcript_48407/g.140226  ORF Transcript_48407/g.140226 Transcript_48407/m.140226 type:complete len:204 (+) Transcript_48407:125-736(+)
MKSHIGVQCHGLRHPGQSLSSPLRAMIVVRRTSLAGTKSSLAAWSNHQALCSGARTLRAHMPPSSSTQRARLGSRTWEAQTVLFSTMRSSPWALSASGSQEIPSGSASNPTMTTQCCRGGLRDEVQSGPVRKRHLLGTSSCPRPGSQILPRSMLEQRRQVRKQRMERRSQAARGRSLARSLHRGDCRCKARSCRPPTSGRGRP